MKKLLFIPIFLIIVCNSYSQTIKKEEKQLNAGIGLSSWGLPLYVGLDYGITNEITIGGEFTFRSYQEKFNSIRYIHSIVGVQANANYHFAHLINDLPPEIDIYGGINAGFFLWMSPSSYPGERISRPGFGLQFGGRYALSNKLSGNLEISGGNAFAGVKIGISLFL